MPSAAAVGALVDEAAAELSRRLTTGLPSEAA